ncbi:hypothetical protein [Aquibacillus albus]|uniref:Uncharacterized protein n=1 Tax=Aquibacillus albus TaxID=1168171 RepID=A0ABS2N3N1_9BACI|nr:hypothetical protein [Aquibacillus albus]MBM7572742.1 hypothetical protein [Aquibacillus albus]
MNIEIWPNNEKTFWYIGKTHLEVINIKRNSSFTSTFIQHTHGWKEGRM